MGGPCDLIQIVDGHNAAKADGGFDGAPSKRIVRKRIGCSSNRIVARSSSRRSRSNRSRNTQSSQLIMSRSNRCIVVARGAQLRARDAQAAANASYGTLAGEVAHDARSVLSASELERSRGMARILGCIIVWE